MEDKVLQTKERKGLGETNKVLGIGLLQPPF